LLIDSGTGPITSLNTSSFGLCASDKRAMSVCSISQNNQTDGEETQGSCRENGVKKKEEEINRPFSDTDMLSAAAGPSAPMGGWLMIVLVVASNGR